MKKSLLSIALLAITASSVNAASNENVNVRFTGLVKAATCQVTVGQNGNLVDLGRLDVKPNAEGTLIPVMFNFKNCTAATTTVKDITFVGGQAGGQHQTQQGILGTDKKNVEVRLHNDTDTANGTFQAKVDINKQVNNGADTLTVTPFYAQLKAGGQAPETGTVTTVGLFTVNYQ